MNYHWVLRKDTKAVFLAAIDRRGDGVLTFRPITLLTPRYDLEAEKFLLGPRVGCGGLVDTPTVELLSRVWDAAPFSTVRRDRTGWIMIHVLRDAVAEPDVVTGATFEEAVRGAVMLLGVW